jgi:hypothetical protein
VIPALLRAALPLLGLAALYLLAREMAYTFRFRRPRRGLYLLAREMAYTFRFRRPRRGLYLLAREMVLRCRAAHAWRQIARRRARENTRYIAADRRHHRRYKL